MNIIIKWGFWVYGWQLFVGLVVFVGVWPHMSFTHTALLGAIAFTVAPFVFVHDFTNDKTMEGVERDTLYYIATNAFVVGLVVLYVFGFFTAETKGGEFMSVLFGAISMFMCGIWTGVLAWGCSPYSNLQEPRLACFIAATPLIGPPLGWVVKRYFLPRLAGTV